MQSDPPGPSAAPLRLAPLPLSGDYEPARSPTRVRALAEVVAAVALLGGGIAIGYAARGHTAATRPAAPAPLVRVTLRPGPTPVPSSAPAGSAPAGGPPAGSAPAGSTPSGSAPAGGAPSGSAPSGTLAATPTGAAPAPSFAVPVTDMGITLERISLTADAAGHEAADVRVTNDGGHDFDVRLQVTVTGPDGGVEATLVGTVADLTGGSSRPTRLTGTDPVPVAPSAVTFTVTGKKRH